MKQSTLNSLVIVICFGNCGRQSLPGKLDPEPIEQIHNKLQFAETADLWKFVKPMIGAECYIEFSQHSSSFVKFVAEGFISDAA